LHVLLVLLGNQYPLPAVRQEQSQAGPAAQLHQLLPMDTVVSRLPGAVVLPATTHLEDAESQVGHHSEQHHRRRH